MTTPALSSSALPVVVFDSGIGGLSVLRALRRTLPGQTFIYLADGAASPYGERDAGFVRHRVLTLLEALLRTTGPTAAIVLACNTATALAIADVRTTWASLPVVGIEPALKPAVTQSRTRHIGVLATRGTLQSEKFRALRASMEPQAQFVCQAADGLAAAVDRADAMEIRALCAHHICAMGQFGIEDGAIDTLVLGCTHYPLVSDVLQGLVGPTVSLLDPADAVARQTARLLAESAPVPPTMNPVSDAWYCTGNPVPLAQATLRWLNVEAKVSTLSV